MKYSLFAPCLLSAALAACGGGGDSAPSAPASAPASSGQAFTVPAVGTTWVYAETLVDNLNNTVNRTAVETFSEVHADGSFTLTKKDPGNQQIFLGVENYSIYPTVIEYDADGQAKQYVTSYPDGASDICVIARTSATPTPPNTWSFTYTETCGGRTPVTYNRSGAYLGTETLTVPAGTFNADKYQSSYIRTNSAGTTVTETTIAWQYAAANDFAPIKKIINFAYSGTAARPNSLVSFTRVLQSRR